MITASTIHSIKSGARMLLLAGTLALASFMPAASAVYADAGSTQTPVPASAPVLTAAQAFDVAPGTPLENVPAVVVANTGGAPLLAEPKAEAEVMEVLSSGTEVTLRIDQVDTVYTDNGNTRWWPVDVGGSNGWVNGQSLMSPEDYVAWSASDDGTSGADSPGTPNRQPFDYTGELDGATAQVNGDGQGLIMRAEPNGSAEQLASIPEGTIISLRIADVDTVYDDAGTRWWPVSYEGQNGWVSGFYLVAPGTDPSQPASQPTAGSETPAPSGDNVYQPGNWAVVRTANSGRTDLYSTADPTASVAGTVPHMALVEIISQAPNGWYEVKWDTVQGFISGDLLSAGTAPRTNVSPTPTPAPVSTATAAAVPTAPMAAGDIAIVDSESDAGVNIRESASSDAERLGYLDDEERVTIISGPTKDPQGNDWYEVRGDELEGWVRADLLKQGAATNTQTTVDTDTGNVSQNGFILPLTSYRFTQDYGCSNLGFYSYDPNWGCAVHDGVDMAAPQGTPLLAVADGTIVVNSWNDGGLGYYIEIDHGDGVHTIYGHMAAPSPLAVGTTVTRGQEVGQVGSTGLSTGPHVHFMVRKDGVTQDPKNYLPAIQTSN